MIQIVKQHKLTGEIVKVDGKKEWTDLTGTIPAAIFAKIKAATEQATDWIVIRQEGKYESPAYKMSKTDKELKDYCESRARIERAMNY